MRRSSAGLRVRADGLHKEAMLALVEDARAQLDQPRDVLPAEQVDGTRQPLAVQLEGEDAVVGGPRVVHADAAPSLLRDWQDRQLSIV